MELYMISRFGLGIPIAVLNYWIGFGFFSLNRAHTAQTKPHTNRLCVFVCERKNSTLKK